MAALGPAMKVLARHLLTWDRARIVQSEARGYDCTIYIQRQDLAEVAIDADVDAWPEEVKKLFMALLEMHRTATRGSVEGIGVYRPKVNRPNLIERIAMRNLAVALGELRGKTVIERLREVSPRHWAEEDTEGD